ncbi:hypothetical protein AJ80_03831 [Polytolypa hystricis UAMH7299]|uniref:Uncharacterized protein n=1 Tax=Polytolypa hystricis (strain UAMH7299) TaxID=1447883 RepID=A0A2B7YDR4_POLH7|nr:hypothetical protein AJ80_03831 [Polytolypa hystricis UAMH7299]
MSWNILPYDLEVLVLTEVCVLGEIPRRYCDRYTHNMKVRSGWKPIVEAMMVCKSCRFASESIALEALNKHWGQKNRVIGQPPPVGPPIDHQAHLNGLLTTATIRAFPSCMAFLLERGAKSNIQLPNSGCGLLTAAVENGCIESLEVLLGYDAPLEWVAWPIEYSFEWDNTPLGLAVYYRRVDMIPLLLRAGADPDVEVSTYHSSYDLLQLAASNLSGKSGALKALLENGIRVNNENYSPELKDHPLEFAVHDPDKVRLLLKAGAKVDDMESILKFLGDDSLPLEMDTSRSKDE